MSTRIRLGLMETLVGIVWVVIVAVVLYAAGCFSPQPAHGATAWAVYTAPSRFASLDGSPGLELPTGQKLVVQLYGFTCCAGGRLLGTRVTSAGRRDSINWETGGDAWWTYARGGMVMRAVGGGLDTTWSPNSQQAPWLPGWPNEALWQALHP